MLPETYKKIVVMELGKTPSDCLKIVHMKIREPSAHEILVRNHYAGVNSTDIGRMMGVDEWHQEPPFDFGIEAIGEVIAVGDRIEQFKVGDAVATALPGNGYREYTTIDANFALKIPAIDSKYVGIFISGVRAKIALDFVADMQSGETVLVTSALGSSGHFAAQLAKQQGCHVIGTCANEEEAEQLKQLQVDRIINRETDNLADILADEYDQMLNLVYDTMGGSILDTAIQYCAPRARIIIAEALREHIKGDPTHHTINFYRQLIRRSVSVIGFNLSDYANAIPIESLKLLEQIEQGILHSMVDSQSFAGIEHVGDAIQHVMNGTSQGKVVVKLV